MVDAKKKPVAKKAPAKVVAHHGEGEDKKKSLTTKADVVAVAVGRRKAAVARIRLVNNLTDVIVNDKAHTDYFGIFEFQQAVMAPLVLVDLAGKLGATVKVVGGGMRGQAEAIRHGITRALIEYNPEFKKTLRSEGFVTRDSRGKERKKPGLKSARRAPQFSKR